MQDDNKVTFLHPEDELSKELVRKYEEMVELLGDYDIDRPSEVSGILLGTLSDVFLMASEIDPSEEETNRLLRMSRYLNTLHVCLLSNSFKLDILVDVFMKVLGRTIGTHLSEERDEQRDNTPADV